jgi:hypothetical protein
MKPDRQALHDLIEHAPDEQLPRLLDLVTRFLHPPESPAESEVVTFVPRQPGPTDPEAARRAAIERRQRLLGEGPLETSASQLIRQHLLPALDRLGLSVENLISYPGGYGGMSGAEGFLEIERNWREETGRHRLGAFALHGQEIVTYERAQVSETGSELIYRVRMLTPANEAESELHIPL